MLSLSAIDDAGNVTTRLNLDATFYIKDLHSAFRTAPTAIPRAHGDRLPDTLWLGGKPIVISGFIGTGTASSEVGPSDRTSSGGSVMGLVSDSTTAAGYLAELQAVYARLHQQRTCVLDYGNGWFQYVKVQGIAVAQVEGWPDLREVSIAVYASDPLAYSTTLTTGTVLPGVISLLVTGYAPSPCWVITLQQAPAYTAERSIYVASGITGACAITLPSPPTQLVIDAYLRTIYTVSGGVASLPDWSRWGAGSAFWTLQPNNGANVFNFYNDSTRSGLCNFGSEFAVVTLAARGADWIGETVPIVIPPPSQYGVAEFGVSSYA